MNDLGGAMRASDMGTRGGRGWSRNDKFNEADTETVNYEFPSVES